VSTSAVEIHHHGREALDLQALAGRQGVQIFVYRRGTVIRGDAELGPGSEVRGAWDEVAAIP
jgi:hypothetical protein